MVRRKMLRKKIKNLADAIVIVSIAVIVIFPLMILSIIHDKRGKMRGWTH